MLLATFRPGSMYEHSTGLAWTESGFEIQGAGPTSPPHVRQMDLAGEMVWVSDETHGWFVENYGSAGDAGHTVPESAAAAVSYPAVVAEPSFFSSLPVWLKVLFVVLWPVSIPYAIVRVWKRRDWSTGAKAAVTACGVVGMLVLLSMSLTTTGSQPPNTPSVRPSAQQAATPGSQPVPTDSASGPSGALGAVPKAAATAPSVETAPATVVRVVDGDTARFRLEDGSEQSVRFIGIDTPESTKQVEVYGKEASRFTAGLLTAGRVVYLEKDVEARDKYGRLLAYVWLGRPTDGSDAEIRSKMLNARLALKGYAQQMTIQPNSKYADDFRRYVAEARSAERGLWNPAVAQQSAKPAPTPTPTPVPKSAPITASYIGNSNTHKFHRADCPSVGQMNEGHRVPFSSAAAAKAAGYVPCKNCRP